MYFTGTSSPTSLLLFPVTCAKSLFWEFAARKFFHKRFLCFLPKTVVKIETVLVSSTDRLVAFRARVSILVLSCCNVYNLYSVKCIAHFSVNAPLRICEKFIDKKKTMVTHGNIFYQILSCISIHSKLNSYITGPDRKKTK